MVTVSETVLDLVQILEEAAASGRLFGSEETTISEVLPVTDASFARAADRIMLKLSDESWVELKVETRRIAR